jgi:hypothetical protein
MIRSGRSRIRSTAVALAFALAAGTTIAEAAAQVVPASEDDGAGCAVSIPGSFPSNSKLPDPFTRLDGTRIATKSDWRCRREEIKQLSERYVYGDKHAKPQSVTGTVSRTSISVTVQDQGKSASFSASVQLPSGNGPFPAVIVYGGFGADPTTIQASGAAVINFDPYAVGKEGFLLKTGNAAGVIRISGKKTGNLADRRTWQTPVLADGPASR